MDKKYTQGFSDGVSANAESIAVFNKKQEEAFEAAKEIIIKKINEHGEIFDFVIDELEYNESLRNFGLRKDYSINELEDTEKILLCSAIYTLLTENGENSELQKKFFYGVQKYLEIADYQKIVPENLLNIDSNSACNTIFRVICEFLFLKNANFDFFESYPWLEDIVRKSEFRKTTEFIEQSYRSLGLEVFVSHYNFSDEIFEPEIENTENEGGTPVITEDIAISEALYISAENTETFTNKSVHISSYITCEGSLVFKNCIIFYNESLSSDEISLKNGASLVLDNCYVFCKGLDKSPFITAENSSSIKLSRCSFVDCSYFVDGKDIEFEMTDCHILNAGNKFIEINSREHISQIKNCVIEEKELADFNLVIMDYLSSDEIEDYKELGISIYESIYIFSLALAHVSDVNCICSEKFNEKDIFWRAFITSSSDSKFVNCYFEACSDAIYEGQVESCKFVNCTGVIHEATSIKHCSFNNCYGNLIYAGVYTNQIESCEFTNCNCQDKGNLITLDVDLVDEITIEKCKFINCIFGRYYAISFSSALGSFHIESDFKNKRIRVSTLAFLGCVTSSDDKVVCNPIITYNNGVFREKLKTFTAFSVHNSTGLNSVKYVQDASVESPSVSEPKQEQSALDKAASVGSKVALASGIASLIPFVGVPAAIATIAGSNVVAESFMSKKSQKKIPDKNDDK